MKAELRGEENKDKFSIKGTLNNSIRRYMKVVKQSKRTKQP